MEAPASLTFISRTPHLVFGRRIELKLRLCSSMLHTVWNGWLPASFLLPYTVCLASSLDDHKKIWWPALVTVMRIIKLNLYPVPLHLHTGYGQIYFCHYLTIFLQWPVGGSFKVCCSKCTCKRIYCNYCKLSDCFIYSIIIDLLKMVKPWWRLCKLPKHQYLRKAIIEYLSKKCNNSVTTWIFCFKCSTIVWTYLAYNIIYSRISISRTRISRILRRSKRLSESKIRFDCFLQP